jgi:negative regulator of sigma E activity
MSGHPGELLSAFLDGELSAADQAAVEGHLRECAACAREFEELAAVDAFARGLPVPAPAGYFEELPGRVRARVRRPARVPRLAVWAAAAAAAVMAVTVTPLLMQRERSVTAPAAQSAPYAPAAGSAAPSSTVPPPEAGFADAGATRDRVRPAPSAKREAQGRLLERDRADKPAALPAPSALPRPAEEALGKTKENVGGLAQDRMTGGAAPTKAPAESELAAAPSASARAVPTADAQKERAAPPPERKLAASGGAFAHPDDRALMIEKRYQALLSRSATSAAQARALRDAWDLFARDVPAPPRADEARVRAMEAGALAWRLGHDPDDLAATRARARAYLDAETAPQAARVRAVLESLPPGP